jgi:hypothetical protein
VEFHELIEIVGNEPAFETGLLLAGDVDPSQIRRQLTRWTKARHLYQLRRGLYALAPPYQKTKPHPFVIANRMAGGSYISCQSALAFYGVIPESVPTIVSVCADRPRRWDTPLGSYLFRHLSAKYIFGYRLLELDDRQQAFVATPEKALLDLIYLTPQGDSLAYLRSLRLQNLDTLSMRTMSDVAKIYGKPKLRRGFAAVESLVRGTGGLEDER